MATKRDEQAADYRAEAIARPFADAAERSSTVSKTGDGQSGLRTERVTLEVTHDSHLNCRDWPSLRTFFGESVRVVEDCCLERIKKREVIRQRDAAIRERDAARKSWLRSEESGTRLLAERNAALDAADGLRKRVAELEAASGGGEIRDMTDIILSDTDADEKHAAIATLVEAVCPGWVLARDDKWQAENAEAFCRLQKQFDDEWQGTSQAASGGGEPKLAPHANAVGGSNHAAQAASGGGEGEAVADDKPFAWAVVEKRKDATWCYAFRNDKDHAQREFPPSEFFHFPVYRAPPQPRGWLTEEERDALESARLHLSNFDAFDEKTEQDARWASEICASLLARSSPPEVVLRDFPPDTIGNLDSHYLAGWNQCMALAKKALAAAGVAVKEGWE